MFHRRNHLLGTFTVWVAGPRNRRNAFSAGSPHARGDYRSSRDTATRVLRTEDANLQRLPMERPSTDLTVSCMCGRE